MRVYTRLSATEPFRCVSPLGDGRNDSLLPSARPERPHSSPAPSVFPTSPRPGAFSSIFLLPWSLGYPVGTGSPTLLPCHPRAHRVYRLGRFELSILSSSFRS